MQNLKICLASDFNNGRHLYNGLCWEAVQAIASTSDSTIISLPDRARGRLWKMRSGVERRLTGLPRLSVDEISITDRFDCFVYVGMNPENLLMLKALKGWQECAPRSAVFLFESWSSKAHQDRHYLKLLDDFDHVFLFNAAGVQTIQKYTSTPCSFLPAAADCLKATPYPAPENRSIDIYGMGRGLEPVHEQLVDMTRTGELFYLWDHQPGPVANGYEAARMRTHHVIRHSRFFISFGFTAAAKSSSASVEDALPTRLFEGAAGGAVQIGSAPKVAEFRQLFDWPDALIEMPLDPLDVRSFYHELQKDHTRISRASTQAAMHALRRHDWVYRWAEMLKALGLSETPGVMARRSRLSELAAIAEADLKIPTVGWKAPVRTRRKRSLAPRSLVTSGKRHLAFTPLVQKLCLKLMVLTIWSHHMIMLQT